MAMTIDDISWQMGPVHSSVKGPCQCLWPRSPRAQESSKLKGVDPSLATPKAIRSKSTASGRTPAVLPKSQPVAPSKLGLSSGDTPSKAPARPEDTGSCRSSDSSTCFLGAGRGCILISLTRVAGNASSKLIDPRCKQDNTCRCEWALNCLRLKRTPWTRSGLPRQTVNAS